MKAWKRLAAVAALVAIVGASAYFWWWKPLILASLRFGLEHALAGIQPRITFRSVDLHGLSTLVVKGVGTGTLDDDNSLEAREARLSFDLKSLVRSRFDFVAALRSIELVRPQIVLAWPGAILGKPGSAPPVSFPLPDRARFAVSDGRILLRAGGPRGTVTTIHDVDAEVARTTAGPWAFSFALTPPGSRRRSLSAAGTWQPAALKVTVKSSRVDVAPLLPWIAPLKLPFRLEAGTLSSSVDLEFAKASAAPPRTARGPATHWALVRAHGRVDPAGVTVAAPGMPFPVRELSGRARAAGTRVFLERMVFTTSGTAWMLAGNVEDFSAPKVHLELGAPAFHLSLVAAGARGVGPVRLRAEGPAVSPIVTAVFDLRDAEAGGVSATRATGTLTIENWGRQIQLEGGRAETPAGLVTVSGAGSTRAGTADASFALVPKDPLLPQLSGSLTIRTGQLRAEARTGDGVWTLRARGRRRGPLWEFGVDGSAPGGVSLSADGTAGTAVPHRLDVRIELAGASFAGLYLERRHDVFRRLPLKLAATASVRGTPADPSLVANLAGSTLALGRTPLPVTGTLRLSRRALDLATVRAGRMATVALHLPLDGSAEASATLLGEGFPLRLVWALVPVPDRVRETDGAFHGTLGVWDLTGRPAIEGSGEIRDLAWAGTRLGTLGFAVEERDRTMRFSSLKFNGPLAAAEGDGSLTLSDTGWNGATRLNISYLKAGTTDLDAHAEATASSGPKGLEALVRLTSLRMNAAAYPDAEVAVAMPAPDELEVKASWEETLSAVWESRGGKSVSLSASFTDLPVAPLLGMVRLPSPVDQLTGSVSLKGSPAKASLRAEARWARGEITARGWVGVVPTPGVGATPFPAGSVTVNASDRAVAQWLAFLRTIGPYKNLPELDGTLATRGFAADWSTAGVNVNGWITVQNAAIGGRPVGSGSVRVRRSGAETEIEGTVAGEGGEFKIYPTRISGSGDERSVAGSFSWSKVPAGKAQCSCARATIGLRGRPGRSSGSLVFTGLALDDLSAPDITFRFEGDGSAWTLASPPDSPWQAIGTVSAAGGRIVVLPDDRVGGRWVVIKGPGGAQLKLSGTWAIPNAPEKLGFEAHRLPAAPILLAVGAPPHEGQAEADLTYEAAKDPPLSGRLALTGGAWGGFAYDLFEVRGTGVPGHDFAFTSIRVERAGELKAKGSGSLTLIPDQKISLDLSIEKLALRYLKPFGFVEDSDSSGLGRVLVAGPLGDPEVRGSLVCTPGAYTPPTGFAELRLAEGRIDFRGRQATFTATLNDAGGAVVLVAGEGSFRSLVPSDYSVSMTAPTWIRVDGLPRLFKGLGKGRIRLEGTIAEPVLKGEVQLQQGRLQSPPKNKKPDPQSFPERVDWDLKVRIGEGVSYAVEPVAGAAVDVAQLSSRSYLHVKGKGADFEVFGEVLADSGPVTLIMGKQLFRKEAP